MLHFDFWMIFWRSWIFWIPQLAELALAASGLCELRLQWAAATKSRKGTRAQHKSTRAPKNSMRAHKKSMRAPKKKHSHFYFLIFWGSQISGLGPLGPSLGPPTWARRGPTHLGPAWAHPRWPTHLGPAWAHPLGPLGWAPRVGGPSGGPSGGPGSVRLTA